VRELAELRAGLGREVSVVLRPAGRVELHAARLAVGVDEPSEEPGAANFDLVARELRRDPRECILLVDPVLVLRQPDAAEGGDNGEQHGLPER
jgi:hypothetical protein